ncbi:MAG: hypothetical protein JWM75_2059, partial [Sphingomonas bacterium]|nr:hypothetical protein [Sphingomonas bacterium]
MAQTEPRRTMRRLGRAPDGLANR